MMTTSTVRTYAFPTRVQFGFGAAKGVADCVSDFRIRAALLLADQGVTRAGLTDRVARAVRSAGVQVTVFDKIHPPGPTDNVVSEAYDIYRRKRCQVTIAMGGGSVMDTAKAVRLLATHGGDIRDYNLALRSRAKITPIMPRLICIPTTAGTGSEVSAFLFVTDTTRNVKIAVASNYLIPTVALVDPGMTFSLSPIFTAATGMEALAHSVEICLNGGDNPLADGFALTSVRLVAANLKTAVKNGRHKEARKEMSMAAMMSGMALTQKGVGLIHSLANTLSAQCGIPSGVAMAVMLPHVVRLHAPKCPKRIAEIGSVMGVPTEEMTAREGAASTIETIERLIRRVKLPLNLEALGVEKKRLESLSQAALADMVSMGSAREWSERSILRLYQAAFK